VERKSFVTVVATIRLLVASVHLNTLSMKTSDSLKNLCLDSTMLILATCYSILSSGLSKFHFSMSWTIAPFRHFLHRFISIIS
jgi:hypothetical protein